MKHLQLERPLVFFDLETTGTDPARDKIVEITLTRIEPGGERVTRTRRINPECPIPPGATAVHGIREEDVRDEPPFRRIARGLLDLLADADIAGFNVRRFDLPLLDRELRECDLDLKLDGRRIVDAMTIFHRKEPRDLSAAVRHYLGRVFATAASLTLRLPVYDTQCGAKLFRCTDEVRALFAEPFVTGWIFDVELIARLIRGRGEGGTPVSAAICELPLYRWADVSGSKVKSTDFLVAFREMLRIWRRYMRH